MPVTASRSARLHRLDRAHDLFRLTAMPSKLRYRRQAWLVLGCEHAMLYRVSWSMMFGGARHPGRRMLQLSATEVGLMMGLPILTGSLVRMPLGPWTDRSYRRRLMVCMLAPAIPPCGH